MRVAAVWQVLMPVAHEVERVQIVTRRERGFEDMTISFAETFAGSLNDVLRQFEKMPWVATVELASHCRCCACAMDHLDASPAMRGRCPAGHAASDFHRNRLNRSLASGPD
jgi:hypothetical protein